MVDIKGFEGLYAVTSCGKVWSYRRNKFLSPVKDKYGYYYVYLWNKGKHNFKLIHRLVAEAYIDNHECKDTVDHIDNNKENNSVNNLQWLTVSENSIKRNGDRVYKILCVNDGRVFDTQTECANFYGISVGQVNMCIMGRIKTAHRKIFRKI